MKKILLLLLVFSLLLVSGLAFGKVYKLAHPQTKAHPDHLAYQYFADKVKEYTKGSIDIKIYSDAVLGDVNSALAQGQQGVITFVHSGAANLEGLSKEYSVFGLPYVFDSREHFLKAMNGALGDHFKTVPEAFGLHGVMYLYAGSRNFYGKKPFKTPADLKGFKFRVQQSPVAVDMVKALGAVPTPMAYGEVFSALQQGVIDGAENNEPSYVSQGHYEVAKFFSYDEHQMVPDFLLVNLKQWQGFTQAERDAIDKAAVETQTKFLEFWDAAVKDSVDKAKAKGSTFVQVDKAAYQAAVKPLIDSAKQNPVLAGDIKLIEQAK